VGAVAGAEPAALVVARIGNGHATQVSAHTKHNKEFLFDAARLVRLGVAERLPVDCSNVSELFSCALLDENRLATPPVEKDVNIPIYKYI